MGQRLIIILFVPFLLVVACKERSYMDITNPGSSDVDLKRFVLDRVDFNDFEKAFILLKNPEGDLVPVQHDDLDGDGSWDVLAFEYSLNAGQSVRLSIQSSSSQALPEFEKRTDAYLGYSPGRDSIFTSVTENTRPSDHVAMSTPYLYQFEGPGWESDKVAFRSYFDSRNGKDIFGKIKPDLCVTEIGKGANYHNLQSWGMDVLKVGGSLGAGALSMLKNDSLYRLGETGQASFKIVADGPVRSIIELRYKDWLVDGINYELVERISIWAGKRSYQSEVTLLGGTAQDTLVTGIVDLKHVFKAELNESDYQIIFTHGEQSENKDILGMGVLIPQEYSAGFGVAPEKGSGITNTYTVKMIPVNNSYTYHFYVGWELENKVFADKEAFQAALLDEARELNQKIELKIKN